VIHHTVIVGNLWLKRSATRLCRVAARCARLDRSAAQRINR
jgi:hypothetical protein